AAAPAAAGVAAAPFSALGASFRLNLNALWIFLAASPTAGSVMSMSTTSCWADMMTAEGDGGPLSPFLKEMKKRRRRGGREDRERGRICGISQIWNGLH
ncbi:hypothetical protein PENTCL1PPCAC_7261, partial [Pristionchus entomophagus]